MSFVSELKRRKVFQVAAVYLVVAWLIMQVVDVVNEPLLLPDWFARVVILLLAVGFPIAVILSWAFDLTPEGVVRDEGSGVVVQRGGRRMEYVFSGLLVIAVATLLYREFTPPELAVEVVPEESQREVLPNSVAVLPFENLTLDPEYAFFAPGIHDTILNELAKISDLNVIARTSMERYADTDMSIKEIAEELNVETVMEGSVQYAENRVLITVQLIDPETNAHIWSENYDREFARIFEIQADIATRIAMALEVELLPQEQASLEKVSTSSSDAYSAYLQARALVSVIEQTNPPEFYDYLNQAIEIDPDFALAHATKAFGYANKLTGAELGPFLESHEELEAIARLHLYRAMDLDPTQSLVWGALALIAEAHWRGAEARMNWERAVELGPNDADILGAFARFNAYTRRNEEAIRLANRVEELNPDGAVGVLFLTNVLAGNHVKAVSSLREMISAEPTNAVWRQLHGHLQLALGNNEAALEDFLAAEELLTDRVDSSFYLAGLAYAYGRLGRSADAQRYLDQLEAYDQQGGRILARDWAIAYLGVGDHKRALDRLKLAAESRNPGEGGINITTMLARNAYSDPVLDQPEFVEVRRRLGFRE